mgnify:CR=1 FL=1
MPNENSAARIQMIRTRVGSIPRYSAIPPQMPANLRSRTDRYNRAALEIRRFKNDPQKRHLIASSWISSAQSGQRFMTTQYQRPEPDFQHGTSERSR